MSYPTCPHCGANRDNMPDSQKCWRCGRLPATAVAATNLAPMSAPPPRPQQPLTPPPPPQPQRPFISVWLAVTGALGLALFGMMLLGSVLLIVTAEDATEEPDTLSELDPSAAVATAFPTNTSAALTQPLATANLPPTTSVDSAATAGPSITDPFAATTAAIEVNGNSAQSTLLPMPSPQTTNTATPPVSPTPIVCPGVVLPRLQINGMAEVVVSGTIRVRTQAGLGGALVLNIGRSETVAITGAPICTDGFLWWPIALVDGTTGWVAEGDAGQYFLEPR